MKALSVRAPWWWHILYAGKDIENRDWATGFRGTIYLHASKWWKQDEVEWDLEDADRIATRGNLSAVDRLREGKPPLLKSDGGCIVGKMDIVDCVSSSRSPWFFGKYGFVLANPVAFTQPIPFKGALGFFDVPDGIEVGDGKRTDGDD